MPEVWPRENRRHAEQSQSSSSGRGSVRNSARLMLSRPSRVNAAPLRPMRVGRDAVEQVDAAAHAFDEILGKPTPMR